ncbi:hypothetical protein GLAREA_04883 [Glarea lozoyensis ATCC 20868]|uniref:Uncharacterized protein n=1 Tax=Glarea lozoyensis (strain ATCC 20868 / MF5171) TaxID=1116229 RepID=S3CNK4_GLAL2|nr:uncharacterized protein GLAREA_04883 [Glarea lozoyensis ATCC 20868]EPE28092.1 hypothetical protein GLAREA_04883 [Glarea lozoyensis ATCC 20868]
MRLSSTVAVATLFLNAELATAINCTRGLYYCGATLIALGGNRERIDSAMPKCSAVNVYLYSLFECLSDTGEIRFIQTCCNKCIDGGLGHSDYCEPVAPTCRPTCSSVTTTGSTLSVSTTRRSATTTTTTTA